MYEWSKKFNSEIRGVTLNDQPDAELVGNALDAIQENDGGITPEALLKVSTPTRSKTHKMFEWDDTVAGDKYRLEQARLVLRSIDVIVQIPDDGERSIRAFTSTPLEGGKRVYVNTVSAMQQRDTRDAMLQDCLNALIKFREKWANLVAVADATAPLDLTIDTVRKAIAG